MREAHRQWVQVALDNGKIKRETEWSESIAVGRLEFLESILNKLHPGHRGRRIVEVNGHYELREEPAAYLANFTAEKDSLNQNKAPLLSDS
jgi:putative transposase